MRREIKFEITLEEYNRIYNTLNKFIEKDKNTKRDDKYSIKTIYYDNIYNQLLNENIDGLIHRKKFRIRMYNNDKSTIFLEKKEKIKDVICKKREKISYEDVLLLCNNDLDNFELTSDLRKELYIDIRTKLLKPIIIVEYDRIAFDNKTMDFRITLDSKLGKSDNIHDFFNISNRNENVYILEVKYSDCLPKIIVDSLNISSQRQGISKYKNMRLSKRFVN